MQIIPVIDLMSGHVVHAQRGLRDQYRPIQSQLCRSSEPLAIISALIELYPFNTLYIADIDSIRGQGQHEALIHHIAEAFPALTLWLDCGKMPFETHTERIVPVMGSESFSHIEDYLTCAQSPHVLSLDHDASSALGPSALHQSPDVWPQQVIAMTLNAVGSNAGVDTARLQAIQQRNQTRPRPAQLFAAGGVRDKADLEILAAQGISGALVATALHRRTLSTADIAACSQ